MGVGITASYEAEDAVNDDDDRPNETVIADEVVAAENGAADVDADDGDDDAEVADALLVCRPTAELLTTGPLRGNVLSLLSLVVVVVVVVVGIVLVALVGVEPRLV